MKIAVIGSGISGLGAAFVLQRRHQVTLFEKADHAGGHTLTLDVEHEGAVHAVDTGFVVFNYTTYPNFVRLLEALGVGSQPTSMSFSVRSEATGLEYCGTSLNTVFAQRLNLFRPGFHRLMRGILKFNRVASQMAEEGAVQGSLGEFLDRHAPSNELRNLYLVPLVAAIWSMDPDKVSAFPAEFFLRFCLRHRLLQVSDQLQWRVVKDGSREYVRALVGRLDMGVQTGTAVRSIRRLPDHVEIILDSGRLMEFDHVVIATHSDQALAMLADPTDDEQEVLGAIAYQENEAVLHTDIAMLPRTRRAWANWNYLAPSDPESSPVTTYDMSGLQGIQVQRPLLLTLNDNGRVDPDHVIDRVRYAHPVYDIAAVQAQKDWGRISGIDRTHYCGAYWGYGFHEDGLASGLRACRFFGLEL